MRLAQWCQTCAQSSESLKAGKVSQAQSCSMAVDTLGHLLAVHVTPANEQERDQVDALCQAVQQATGSTVEKAWIDQGYTGQRAKAA